MLVSVFIILGCFIGVVALILSNKMNRAVAALIGALICYFVLIYLEGADYAIIIQYLVGTPEEGYVNLRSLVLILGMMIIVQVCHEAGVFQFLAFRLLQATGGNPKYLLLIMCTVATLLSAVLNNVLSLIVLIPLTVMVSRILNIDPRPYIIAQGVIVNVGATFFSISSIPNILIATSTGITFSEFFVNMGVFSILMFGLTLGFFNLYFKRKTSTNEENIWILREFNAWNFVQDRKLLIKSISVLASVLVAFIVIPATIVPLDIIAILGAAVLLVISGLDAGDLIKKVDFELIVYLLGIFIISGALETVGVLQVIGIGLANLTGGEPFATLILILWVSAFLSASIDNIPITKVLIPVVDQMSVGASAATRKLYFYGLIFGANWGDNLTPMGDNIIVMRLAEQNKRPINVRDFFLLGFTTTILQLVVLTVFFSFLMNLVVGILLLVAFVGGVSALWFVVKRLRARGKSISGWIRKRGAASTSNSGMGPENPTSQPEPTKKGGVKP